MDIIELRKSILKLIHECQFCAVSINLDYPKTANKSISGITEMISGLVSGMEGLLEPEYLGVKTNELTQILGVFLPAQKQRDMVMISDVISQMLLPWLIDLSDGILDSIDTGDINYLGRNLEALIAVGQKDVCDAVRNWTGRGDISKYIPCFADTGDISFTTESEFGITRLISARSPMESAMYYFYKNRKDEVRGYAVAGANMIYEAMAILRINIGTKVSVIEEDISFLTSVLTYMDLSDWILSGRLTFVCKDVLKNISGYIVEQSLLVKNTSASVTTNPELKRIYENYRQLTLTVKEQNYLLYHNYNENLAQGDEYVSSVINTIRGKDLFLIAGGPSLNRAMDILKRKRDNGVILCVGTSAGKLLKDGIDPDLVIISDPLPEIEKQLDLPFDINKTSLIYLVAACSEAVKGYKGKRYVVFQEGFLESEKEAADKGFQTFLTGGSVTTLALDIALRFEPARIILFGLDLAYTGNLMHASGIHQINNATEDSEKRFVRDVKGQMISTAQTLETYKKWVEKRLDDYNGPTKILNISDGAYIEGAENICCDDAEKRI